MNNHTNGIFSPSAMEKVKQFKNILQKATIWTFVIGVLLGALMILFANSSSVEILLKFMGTMFILAAMTLVSFINFKGLESGNPGAQRFSILGLIMNICWALLWIMAMWGVFDIYDKHYHYGSNGFSILGQLTFISTYLSALGLFGAVILQIYEGRKRAIIRPLKITALVCLIYEEVYGSIRVIAPGTNFGQLDALAVFTGFVWIIAMIIAAIISKAEKDSLETQQTYARPQAPKTDQQLRAEIEEQVRREMIEKEVRERLAREQQGFTNQ